MSNPGSTLHDFQARHQLVRDKAQIEALLADFNTRVHSCGLYFQWDEGGETGFTSYESLPKGVAVVLGSFDFCYYYDLELAFHEVLFHDLEGDSPWADHWSKDQLMLLPASDAEAFMSAKGLTPDNSYYLFGFNIGSHSDNMFLILARGFSWYSGTVFYYDRLAKGALQEGQRIAWWVSRKFKA